MIKVIVLFLFFAALSLFLTAELLLWLALPILPGAVFRLGGFLLLSALALLFLAGLLRMIKTIVRSVRQYFSTKERIQRRLLFIQGKQDRIGQMLHFRKLHITYFHEQRKKRLLKANDRKHIRALSKTVHKDLLTRKKHLPSPVFMELLQEHVCYRRSLDGAALLRLQQKLAELV